MNTLLEHLGADCRKFWLSLLQSLNGIAVTLGGIVLYVHANYPGTESQLLAALPPVLQGVVLAVFGGLVHVVTRQAKKAGE